MDRVDGAGYSIAAGDVDGGGIADVVIGAFGVSGSGRDRGAAYVVHGPFSGTLSLADADARLLGEHDNDMAGYYVVLGDVDGSGQDDALVAAPQEDSGGEAAGAAYLVLGERL